MMQERRNNRGGIKSDGTNLAIGKCSRNYDRLNSSKVVELFTITFQRRQCVGFMRKFTSMSQFPEESSYQFVIRCVEVIQKTLLDSLTK